MRNKAIEILKKDRWLCVPPEVTIDKILSLLAENYAHAARNGQPTLGLRFNEWKENLAKESDSLPCVRDCFSFAKFLQENFEFHDNTKNGNVYFHKKRKGIFIEQNIYDEWLNNR